MRAVGVLLRWRLRLLAQAARERDPARRAVAGAFTLVFAAVAVGEYRLFTRAFRAMAELGASGPALTLYALEGFFALVLVIGVLSGAATGSTVFFRAAENRLLLAAPVPLRALFLLRSLQTGVLTSWAFGLLAAPALLALGVTYHRRAGFYLAAVVLLLAFLVFGVALGTLLAVVLGRLLGHLRSRWRVLGLTLGALILAGWLVGRSVVPTRAELLTLFEPGTLDGTTVALHFVEEKFRRWPSHPFAAALFGLATGQGHRPARVFAGSLLWPLAAAVFAGWGGGALFRHALWAAAEGALVARPDRAAAAPRGVARFPVFLRGPVGALAEKELLTFARTPQELGRAAFLAFLLLLYTLFFLRVPVPETAGAEAMVARLAALALLAAGYFFTTVALRVAFPALSLEGRAAWILLASPVDPTRLFWARLGLYSLSGFLALGGISLAGVGRLGLPPAALAAVAGLLALMSLTVTAVALALGVCWPDFRGRSAEALATSGGGLLTTALCLGYVALTAWAGHRLVLAFLTGAPTARLLGPAMAAGLGAVAAAAGPLWAARRRHAACHLG